MFTIENTRADLLAYHGYDLDAQRVQVRKVTTRGWGEYGSLIGGIPFEKRRSTNDMSIYLDERLDMPGRWELARRDGPVRVRRVLRLGGHTVAVRIR
jgi:hypothetical protein